MTGSGLPTFTQVAHDERNIGAAPRTASPRS